MPSFETAYFIPNVGGLINRYIGPEDETNLDMTSNAIRGFHREWVYPGYRYLNVDRICNKSSLRPAALKYMTKLNPYLEKIRCLRNECGIKLPSAKCLPKLTEITFAIPLILDTTLRRIHPDTQELWAAVNAFINAAVTREHAVQKIHIVPGVIVLVRTEPATGQYVEEHVLEDMTEGSHLQMFRRYQMPVALHVPRATRRVEIKMPLQLASLASKNGTLCYTTWSIHETGMASVLLDLLD